MAAPGLLLGWFWASAELLLDCFSWAALGCSWLLLTRLLLGLSSGLFIRVGSGMQTLILSRHGGWIAVE